MAIKDELLRRGPELALAILAARQGGPEAAGAFLYGLNTAQAQRAAALQQRQQQAQEFARQADMDALNRRNIESELAARQATGIRAEQDQRTQNLLNYRRMSGEATEQIASTYDDPLAAQNELARQQAILGPQLGVQAGTGSAMLPNMGALISAR